MAQWSFSLRRLNLQVLETMAEFGGYVCLRTLLIWSEDSG
jgi:hypothetical protein